MRVFDASSMIYAWDNYPFGQFPPLWNWMADQIKQGAVTMPSVALEVCAMDEVGVICINFIEYIKESGAIFR